MHAQSLSYVQHIVTPWTIAHQAPLSMEFPRQEYWSGLPFPTPKTEGNWLGMSLFPYLGPSHLILFFNSVLLILNFLILYWVIVVGWVTVESSDKTRSTREGNSKPLQHSCLKNPMNNMKRSKRYDTKRWTAPPHVGKCPICYYKKMEK